MDWRSAIAVVASASTVSGVADVSLFAQSDTRAAHDPRTAAVIALNAHTPVLRVYRGEQSLSNSSVALPPNLTFPEFYRPTIEAMLERSPTFRRQCLRIGQTSQLEVRFANTQTGPSGGARARTRIGKSGDGRLIAEVAIRRLADLPELIAHELEHVIEQLDGVNLRNRSALSDTGVWNCGDGSFETTRAVRIGRVVSSETNPGR